MVKDEKHEAPEIDKISRAISDLRRLDPEDFATRLFVLARSGRSLDRIFNLYLLYHAENWAAQTRSTSLGPDQSKKKH